MRLTWTSAGRAAGSARAVGVTFAAAGILSTAAFARLPSIRERVGATSAQLSLALVCVGIGSVVTMPWTGYLTERFSSAIVVRTFGAVAVTGWTAVAFARSVPVLAASLFVVGAGFGVWDVGMNVQGHTVERLRRRVLMTKWHAMYSYGAVVGAVVGAGAAKLGISPAIQFPILSASTMVVLLSCTAQFAPDAKVVAPTDVEPAHDTAQTATATATARGITRTEVVLGLIVLATAFGEGAANDWLGLTLVDTRGFPEAFGALTLAGFNVTMGTGRILGAGWIARFGRARVLRVSGVAAAGGVTLLCLVDTSATALLGAACWGVGLSVIFPSVMSAAGEIPGRGPRAIAVVSTIGYTGFLVGAPLIGQLTRFVPLDRALLVVAGAGVLIAVLAPHARERGVHASSRRTPMEHS